jgi:hypothetical protein
MLAGTIHKLAWYMPMAKESMDVPSDCKVKVGGMDLREASHYLHCYRNLAFGWDFAHAMASKGLPPPPFLEGGDLWVYRAWLHISGKVNDSIVRDALQLTFRTATGTRDTIKAMLVSNGATSAQVAGYMGMDARVVEAFEKLFYNVVDRKCEGRFLAEVVYPEGRYVEMIDGYIQKESLGNLLLRAGYTNGIEDVLYLAGLPGRTLEALFPGGDHAERLEAHIMMNGYALGRAGFLNQGHVAGMHHARSVMQAIKQGGEAAPSGSPLGGAGDSLLAEITKVKSTEGAGQALMRRSRHKLNESARESA